MAHLRIHGQGTIIGETDQGSLLSYNKYGDTTARMVLTKLPSNSSVHPTINFQEDFYSWYSKTILVEPVHLIMLRTFTIKERKHLWKKGYKNKSSQLPAYLL